VIASLVLLSLATGAGSIAALDSVRAVAPADSPRVAVTDSARVARPDSIAAAPEDSARVVVTLPELRVEHERALSEARRRLPTAFVSELSTGRSNRAIETLSEVLAQSAGVHVDEYGGLGAFSTVSLRGAPPGQVSVYLDGVPLTSAAHGVVNLADLPAGAIDRVEIYRGLAPLAMGPATPGGAINLVTSPAAEVRDLRIARGSYETWEARASAGARKGALSALIHGGLQSSRGDFEWFDDHGTPHNTADDRVIPRLNNRFDAATALGVLRWRANRVFDLSLREDFFRKAEGLPGLGTAPALNTRLSFLRSISELEAVSSPGSRSIPATRLALSLEREINRFRDDGGAFGLGELNLGRHNSDDHFGRERLALELGWRRLPLGFAFLASGDAGDERANLRDPEDGYPDPAPSRRDARGASLGLDWNAPGGRLIVHAARRWDRLIDHLRATGVAGSLTALDVARELDSPQVGARLALPRRLELRANWARAARAPDFLELFGNQGSVSGNPNLRPERGENRDFGGAWSIARGVREAALEWAWFDSRIQDLILYWANSPNTTRADNITSARIRGHELSVRLRPIAPLALAASATWQSAIDTGPYSAWSGKRLPQRPGREAYARADLTDGPVRLSGDVQYLGDDYRDRYNSPRYRVASRTLVGASVSTALHGAARLVLEGKNLGDRRLADVAGYPLPGRSVFVSMEVRLGPAGSAQQ
jgi:iron complex outermembrane receptor protein